MNPKVLVLATTFPRWKGDSEPPFVWELTRRLQARDFDCTVLVPHASGARQEEVWEGVRILRFRYLPESFERVCYDGGALPNLRASWKARFGLGFLLWRQRKWIRKLLRREGFDLVHSHWIIPQGYWAAAACRKHNVPLLLTAHAGDVFGLKGPLRHAAKRALEGGRAVTANSLATAEAVRAILPQADPRIIPMGVDTDLFSAETSSVQTALPGDPAILAVGRFAEKKGFHLLLEAMPRVLAKLPDARLTLVGFGPLEESLRRTIANLELEGKAEIRGPVPHEGIAPLFAAADLFAQPSLPDLGGDKEGQGVTILEAMASGTPVVASRSGGIVDVIDNNVHGVLVEPGKAKSLADGIVRLWRASTQKEWTANARARVEERFSWKSVADRFAELYRETIAGS